MQHPDHQGPGAPYGNDNASYQRKGLSNGVYVKLFVNGKLTTQLKAKLAQELGHKPTTEELRAKVKEAFFKAISEYLEN
jgi:hypothetical protein